MRIVLTNDDGIDAPGLWALCEAVADLGEVHVVAPSRVQSATSHAVTFHRPIRVCQPSNVPSREAICCAAHSVDGRPADCVKLAVQHLVGGPVDLVISGMNAGANVGLNVIYSGTVGAAMEAAFMGIRSIAVSLHLRKLGDQQAVRWAEAARHARDAIDRVLDGPTMPHTVMNINVPVLDDDPQPRGMKFVPVSRVPNADAYTVTADGEAGHHYEIRSSFSYDHHEPNTDVEALHERYVTLTPLHFDLTHREHLAAWQRHVNDGAAAEV
ncbi:5'/3'-nucleotidase SurE [Phycisphaerales bacterium AB-hyl4]|uniref:5'-nucleotidase SurE n=1 Tax=Natronomicrosphaera hydrolytica TaxID=3242702 RepID=A0ABV4U0D2_9BACT